MVMAVVMTMGPFKRVDGRVKLRELRWEQCNQCHVSHNCHKHSRLSRLISIYVKLISTREYSIEMVHRTCKKEAIVEIRRIF